MSQIEFEKFNPNDYFNSNKLNELAVPATDDKGRQIGVAEKVRRPVRVLNAKEADELLRKGVSMNPKPIDEIKQAEMEEAKEASKTKTANYVQVGPVTVPVPSTTYVDSLYDKYFNQRNRITFELEGGSYSLPAIDVIDSGYGIVVILPAGDKDTTFTPAPGAEVMVIYDGETFKCFSPGVVCNVNALNIIIIALVKQNV